MILITSILLRAAALFWSLHLLRKIGDWRMGFLSAMLALMGLRQALTLKKVVEHGAWSPSLESVSVDELPGLVVSVLAGLAVLFLGRMLRDRQRDHEELRARENRLLQAQKMEALGHLAGQTAHDFNNLHAVIIGNAELALAQLPEGHAARHNLEELEKASDRAAELSNQILSFSRKQVVEESVFDLNDVVFELEPMLQSLMGCDVACEARPAAGSALVRADRSQLGQVLMNLAVNARDAMPEGGRLTIATSVERAHAASRPSVVVTVRDTGHGMTAEQRERAFEPFYTTKPVGKGMGLGLSTCLGIVERNGGTIRIASSDRSGTTIRLAFPQATEAASAHPQPLDATRDGAGVERVLVVEDEEQLRALEANALSSRGYRVTEAADGLEALRVVEESGALPDLLVTDIVMPSMGGAELARRMWELDPHLAVLFTSGFVQDTEVDRVAGTGLSEFVQKPFGSAEFARRVRVLLDRRRVRDRPMHSTG